MRRVKRLSVFSSALVGALMSVALVSCHDNDTVSPEIVINPLDKVAYFVSGFVTEESGPISGVTVTINNKKMVTGNTGYYEFEFPKTGTYPVNFSKDGYIDVDGSCVIPSDAKSQTYFGLNQMMKQQSPPVTIPANEDFVMQDATETGSNTTVELPAGAVDKDVQASLTEFIPGVGSMEGKLPLFVFDAQPSMQFNIPATIKYDGSKMHGVLFGNVKHVVLNKNGEWEEKGEVKLDPSTGMYEAPLDGFSVHGFVMSVPSSVLTNNMTETIHSVEVNNLGSMTSKTATVAGTQRMGWELTDDFENSVKTQFADKTAEQIASIITEIEISLKMMVGTAPGIVETEILREVSVSGDASLLVNFVANIEIHTYPSLAFILEDGNEFITDVSIKKYVGVTLDQKLTLGSSHTDHSGGGIQ